MIGSYQDEDVLNGILNGKIGGGWYKTPEDCGFEEDTYSWDDYVPEPAYWWDRKARKKKK
jgi:hypothetical protein